MAERSTMAEAFPLYWPAGWPRTTPDDRRRAAFKVAGFAQVRDGILRELRLLGGQQVVLSTSVPLRLDGLPYAGMREPDDPGVAVYWHDADRGQQRCMACDRWDRVRDNLRAIELSIGALRGLDRWGSSEIVERAFTGFTALPPAAEDWRSVLGLGGRPAIEEVRRRYRELALETHPDRGGSEAAMVRLNHAVAAALEELS